MAIVPCPRTVDGSRLRALRFAAMRVDPAFPRTLAAFAERVGISASYIGKIERGERSHPSFGAVAAICEVGLSITPDDLWLGY